MTLQQLQHMKQWHRSHPQGRGLEAALCDLVLCAWVGGWILLLALAVLGEFRLMPVSLLLTLAPTIYLELRRALHEQGHLRCDWLDALTER